MQQPSKLSIAGSSPAGDAKYRGAVINIVAELNKKISFLEEVIATATNPIIAKNAQEEMASYKAIKNLVEQYKDD